MKPKPMKQKIYRKCPCGETAHDQKYQLPAEFGAAPGIPGRFVWACRNCGALARDRKGAIKWRHGSWVTRELHDRGVGGDDPQTDKGG